MTDEDKRVEDIGDNDEYQFADLDGLGTESLDPIVGEDEVDEAQFEASGEGVSSPPGRGRLDPHMMKVIKNGALVVGGLILFLLIYKFIISFFAVAPETTNKNINVAVKKTPRVEPVKSSASIPVQVMNEALNTTEKKLSVLEQERSRLNTDFLVMHQQIRDVTQTVSQMAASLDEIKQSMEHMQNKLEQQSQQMVRLQSIKRAQRVASESKAKKVTPKAEQTRYFIQAIIPGRAWLMSTQGTMLTVSRGSAVPGYGDVRLINPKLGRIFTSSGRVIQFSQADS